MLMKGLKHVVASNAMRFSIPASVWWVTQQLSGSSNSKRNLKSEWKHYINTDHHMVADFEAVVRLSFRYIKILYCQVKHKSKVGM